MPALANAAPMGTAFTYQGWLMDNKKPANGPHDFGFSLYADPNDGTQLSSTIDVNDLDVTEGYFAVKLDFAAGDPDIFNGDARWLQIAVRKSNGGSFDTLTPRQELTPIPYALHTRGIIVDDAGNVDVDGSMVVKEWIEVGTGTVQINRPQNTITFTEQQGQTSGTIQTDPCSAMPLILNAGAAGDIQLNPTSNGNVGIRSINPRADLDVNGSFYLAGGSGDVTGDGLVNSSDIQKMVNYLLLYDNFTIPERARADINGDCRINSLDLDLVVDLVGGMPLDQVRAAGKRIADRAIDIDYEGNVGIGTRDPNKMLTVVGNIKMVDGNQGQGKVLTSDADGVGTWQTPPDSGIPSGGIIMWSGSIASIPSGWALCNGDNNTPDLRDRFIVGAGSSYGVDETGGTASHTLTIAEMPNHNHSYTRFHSTGDSGEGHGSDHCKSIRSLTTDDQGGGQPHENRPPFYALAFIMRTS